MEEAIIKLIIEKLEAISFSKTPSSSEFEEACKTVISQVGSIENVDYKKGSSRFPDINFSISESKIGVEVKIITSNTWKAKGNSAVASTSVRGLDEIYILAGRFVEGKPPEYKMKPMGECISNVKVTHNPRYEIDIGYRGGDFCKNAFRVKYDHLRTIPKKEREIIIGRYVAEDRYKRLTARKKNEVLAECFILFPEMFSNTQTKFARMNGWLFGSRILSGNIRDSVSGNGKFNYKEFKIPKIYGTLGSVRVEFFKRIEKIPSDVLEYAWKEEVSAGELLNSAAIIPPGKEARFALWMDLVCKIHRSYGTTKVEHVKTKDGVNITNPDLEFDATIRDVLKVE